MPVHGADRLYIGDQLIVGWSCWITSRSYDFCWKTISEIKQSFDSYYSISDWNLAADTNDSYYYMDSTNCLRRNTWNNRYKFSRLVYKDRLQFAQWNKLTITSNHYVTRASWSWVMGVQLRDFDTISMTENNNFCFCSYSLASTSNSWYWWRWVWWYDWRSIWWNSSQIVPSANNYTATLIFDCSTWKVTFSIPWWCSWEWNMTQDEIDEIHNWLWWIPWIAFDNSGVYIKNLSITIS